MILNSLPICWARGATIDEETGEINVKIETMTAERHFLNWVQLSLSTASLWKSRGNRTNFLMLATHFLGFSGSSGPSQSTTRTSSSISIPDTFVSAADSIVDVLVPSNLGGFIVLGLSLEISGSERKGQCRRHGEERRPRSTIPHCFTVPYGIYIVDHELFGRDCELVFHRMPT